MDKKKGNIVISTICYVIGSLAAFAAACVAVSELMPRISGTITKAAAKRTNANRNDDDDWGPVIEKKEVSTEEEGTDAD